jgi:peptidoglycan/LPS O-acetylase OafA/YrhL
MKYIFQGVDFSQLWSRNQTNCLRGIAAIIIVVFHVLIEWEMPRIVNLASSVAVAAFLFLSGFGIHESYKKYGLEKYWLKKFKRIIIPYTLFITVLLPFKSDFDLKAYILDHYCPVKMD